MSEKLLKLTKMLLELIVKWREKPNFLKIAGRTVKFEELVRKSH